MNTQEYVLSEERTTPEDEFERMAENLWTNYSTVISDRESFDKSFDDYFYSGDQDEQREHVWEIIQAKHAALLDPGMDADLNRSAGGKDLERDRQTRAQRVVKHVDEYKAAGAQNVDLQGYDTPKVKPKFTILGRRMNRSANVRMVVYARRITTKRGPRLIDRQGRYVSKKM